MAIIRPFFVVIVPFVPPPVNFNPTVYVPSGTGTKFKLLWPKIETTSILLGFVSSKSCMKQAIPLLIVVMSILLETGIFLIIVCGFSVKETLAVRFATLTLLITPFLKVFGTKVLTCFLKVELNGIIDIIL